MNVCLLIGRLTKDPKITKTESGLSIARFTLAVDRPAKKGEEKTADFPSVVAFGKLAEVIDKYAGKGKQVAITGRITTGSYEKDGKKIYTTEVIADKLELLGKKADNGNAEQVPDGFEALDEELPF